jgi:DNA mismatch repair protein MutL
MALEALLEQPSAGLMSAFSPLPGHRTYESDAEPNGSGGMAAERSPAYGGHLPDGGQEGVVKLRFAGRLFKLFLLAELGEKLFIIDQHAAHERILYEKFRSKPIPTQELLIPIPFSTESDEDDAFLASHREELKKLGIGITGERDGVWTIEALPAGWQLGDGETVEAILNLKAAGKNMAEHWAATLACHGAIKDGDYLDDTAAHELIEAALALQIPRCPNGRHLWVEVSRDDLCRGVQRT